MILIYIMNHLFSCSSGKQKSYGHFKRDVREPMGWTRSHVYRFKQLGHAVE